MSGLEFGDSAEKRQRIMAHIQTVGLKFKETFAKYDIDVIIGLVTLAFVNFPQPVLRKSRAPKFSISFAKSFRLLYRDTYHIMSRL